jgi:hypothetical protein
MAGSYWRRSRFRCRPTVTTIRDSYAEPAELEAEDLALEDPFTTRPCRPTAERGRYEHEAMQGMRYSSIDKGGGVPVVWTCPSRGRHLRDRRSGNRHHRACARRVRRVARHERGKRPAIVGGIAGNAPHVNLAPHDAFWRSPPRHCIEDVIDGRTTVGRLDGPPLPGLELGAGTRVLAQEGRQGAQQAPEIAAADLKEVSVVVQGGMNEWASASC